MPASTVYKPVTYAGKGNGTLKLYDSQLTFQMFDLNATNNTKIFTLPWGKVKRRQVSSSAQTGKPKFKLLLKSGTEAVFQMDDRISLEVLRDDVAKRLQRYKQQYPDSDDEAVNHTRNAQSNQRESTPYRMAKPEPAPKERQSQPYRMAKPSPPPVNAPRQSQPYRMAQKAPPKQEERKAQPYRMVKPDPPKPARESQPYRYVAK